MELSGFFDYLPLEGGDKPHHYEYRVTEKVGAWTDGLSCQRIAYIPAFAGMMVRIAINPSTVHLFKSDGTP